MNTNFNILFYCILTLLLAGCKPVVTITAPANGDTFEVGETITFEGDATDQQHPDLSDDAFVWTSNKDGEIGTGLSFTTADLSAGNHTITLTVADPDGQSGQSSVTITVGNDNVSTSTTTTITTTPTTTTTIATAGQRFVDNGDGTVTDMLVERRLIWLQNANPCGTKNWDDAVAYCSSLKNGMAGLTDGSSVGQWRLPSKEELEGIGTDPPTTWHDGNPPVTWTMPGAPFTNMQSSHYWSGTSYAAKTDWAWYVYMKSGWVYASLKSSDNSLYVWPVRGGNR